MNLDNHFSEDKTKELKNDCLFLDDATYELRKNLDDFDMDFSDAVEDAINSITIRYNNYV